MVLVRVGGGESAPGFCEGAGVYRGRIVTGSAFNEIKRPFIGIKDLSNLMFERTIRRHE